MDARGSVPRRRGQALRDGCRCSESGRAQRLTLDRSVREDDPMSRLLGAGAAVAVATSAVLVAGCGGGATQSSRPSSDPGSAAIHATDVANSSAPWRASLPVTKARALAFARAVNLTAADVPEAKASHRREPQGEEHQPCGLAGSQQELAGVGSPTLTRGSELELEEIKSGAAVVSSERYALSDVAVLRSTAGRACLERFLSRRYLRHAVGKRAFDAHIGQIQLSPLPVQAPGTSGSAGLRITMTVGSSESETSVPVYIDFFVFSLGPAEVTVSAASAVQPEPAVSDPQLGSLLLA